MAATADESARHPSPAATVPEDPDGSKRAHRWWRGGRAGGRGRALDVEPGAGLPRAVRQLQRQGRRRDHRLAATRWACPTNSPKAAARSWCRPSRCHDLRLKLAAQGLPKGGNVGFELMENQKLGVSPVPGTGQLPALARRRAGALDPVARLGGRRARAPGAAEALGLRARPAKADRLGAAQPAAGPRARSGPGQRHRPPGRLAACPNSRPATSPSSTRTATCCPSSRSEWRSASSSTRPS